MIKLFTEHPRSVGESYLEHGFKAISYSIQMLLATVCCLIHAIFPFVFQTTASNIARKVSMDVDDRRNEGA